MIKEAELYRRAFYRGMDAYMEKQAIGPLVPLALATRFPKLWDAGGKALQLSKFLATKGWQGIKNWWRPQYNQKKYNDIYNAMQTTHKGIDDAVIKQMALNKVLEPGFTRKGVGVVGQMGTMMAPFYLLDKLNRAEAGGNYPGELPGQLPPSNITINQQAPAAENPWTKPIAGLEKIPGIGQYASPAGIGGALGLYLLWQAANRGGGRRRRRYDDE